MGLPGNDDGADVISSGGGRGISSTCGWVALTPADTAGAACERRRRQTRIEGLTTKIVIIIPATLPAIMAVMFEPLPPDDDEGVVADMGVPLEDALDVAEGMTDALEGPRIEPGTGSGESIKKMSSETVNRRGKKTEETIPTTDGISFVSVPIDFILECVEIKVLQGNN